MDTINLNMYLLSIVLLGILFGCVSAFILLLSYKWGVAEWYDVHRKKWLPEYCQFCLGFWFSLAQFVGFVLITHNMCLWPSVIVGAILNISIAASILNRI